LKTGEQLDADFVVVGIGVRPQTALAEEAGIAVDRGVTVDPYLETSIPGIWAAGDIARWPDRLSGETIRVEHWVVAERQGQTAARNMLGARERFDAVPFFWSQQHDLLLNYVGHATKWDRVEIDGSLAAKDCAVTYRQSGRKLAVLTIGRDRASLAAEIELEKTIAAGWLTGRPSLSPPPSVEEAGRNQRRIDGTLQAFSTPAILVVLSL
jgi:hypothetical protein